MSFNVSVMSLIVCAGLAPTFAWAQEKWIPGERWKFSIEEQYDPYVQEMGAIQIMPSGASVGVAYQVRAPRPPAWAKQGRATLVLVTTRDLGKPCRKLCFHYAIITVGGGEVVVINSELYCGVAVNNIWLLRVTDQFAPELRPTPGMATAIARETPDWYNRGDGYPNIKSIIPGKTPDKHVAKFVTRRGPLLPDLSRKKEYLDARVGDVIEFDDGCCYRITKIVPSRKLEPLRLSDVGDCYPKQFEMLGWVEFDPDPVSVPAK